MGDQELVHTYIYKGPGAPLGYVGCVPTGRCLVKEGAGGLDSSQQSTLPPWALALGCICWEEGTLFPNLPNGTTHTPWQARFPLCLHSVGVQ